MEYVILVGVIAALVGAVMWNRSNAAAATTGVEFQVMALTPEVTAAIRAAYCQGARAKVATAVGAVRVEPNGANSFTTSTKIGDTGRITVTADGTGSIVRSFAEELYVGSHPVSHFRRGYWGFAARMSHGLYRLLGITPGAARMKRFNGGVERKVAKQLAKAAA